MKKMVNKVNLQGYIYEHKLEKKVTGEGSKAPGTEYITGTIDIATDNECLNIVPVHFTYVTAITGGGKENATYKVLEQIVTGAIGTVMANGKEAAGKVRVDTALGLNEFYTERSGKEEFVSVKRNEGGFVHTVTALEDDIDKRNQFECDIVITGAKRTEADPEKNIPEKVIIKGAIFDFRNSLLPVEFSVVNPRAMDYFEGLEATSKNPVFTKLRGRQIAETITRQIEEESAFGDPAIRTVKSTRKDFVIHWAQGTPYDWDTEETITVAEMNEAVTARATYLATIKQRQDEYKASKTGTIIKTPAAGAFNF